MCVVIDVLDVVAFVEHIDVVVTLLIELSVPTIPPQDVVDVKAIGFMLR